MHNAYTGRLSGAHRNCGTQTTTAESGEAKMVCLMDRCIKGTYMAGSTATVLSTVTLLLSITYRLLEARKSTTYRKRFRTLSSGR